MPLYCYSNPENPDEIIEVVQGINDIHEYEQNGVKWERVFTVPFAIVKDTINPVSQRDFLDKTKGKKDTIGDLWDRSRELSEQREKIYGKDAIKEESEKEYSKVRRGRKKPVRKSIKDIEVKLS